MQLLKGGKRYVVLLWKRDLERVMPDSPSGHAGFHGCDVCHGPALVYVLDGRRESGSKILGRFKDGRSSCTKMEGHAGRYDAILHGYDEPQDAGSNARHR
jgi:hypothetical protein